MEGKRNSSAYNRDVSRRKALRKRRLSEEIYHGGKEHPYYDNLHQYSKNKKGRYKLWTLLRLLH